MACGGTGINNFGWRKIDMEELSINNAIRHICFLNEEDAKEEEQLRAQTATSRQAEVRVKPFWQFTKEKTPKEGTRLLVRIEDKNGSFEAIGRYTNGRFIIHGNQQRKRMISIKTVTTESVIAWYAIPDYVPKSV